MIQIFLALGFGLFLAYSNGANDNFKGVATLFGSRTTTHRKALIWATVTTLAGSLVALIMAQGLLAAFSGKGLVPDQVVAMKSFSLAVPLAAALTVFLATKFGFPISTTHALTGALVGAGVLASPTGVNYAKLGSGFVAPLLISPLVAITATVLIYSVFKFLKTRIGLSRESCACVGVEVASLPSGVSQGSSQAALALTAAITSPRISIGVEPECRSGFEGETVGVKAAQVLDSLHFLSAGVVSFARGLNDTPKIAALLMAGGAIMPSLSITGVAIAIAIGGILQSGKIAEIMSHRVTKMTADQGFTANLVTGVTVLFASKFGVPVSTTHVSCGALFGIGTVTKQAEWKTIVGILIAWVTTLPIAAALGALAFIVMKGGMGL